MKLCRCFFEAAIYHHFSENKSQSKFWKTQQLLPSKKLKTGCCFHSNRCLMNGKGFLLILLHGSLIAKGRKQTLYWGSTKKKPKMLQHSSQRDTHRQWHAHSITNQRGDKGLLHYWLRNCSSNKAIHPGDSVTARYGAEMDASGFSDSDVENWTVDPRVDEQEAPIFPIVRRGRK